MFQINTHFDKTFLYNPLFEYFRWLFFKIKYQIKNHNKNLRIGYKTRLVNVKVGKYNTFYDRVHVENSEIDDFVYIASNSQILNCKIGKFCSIASDVKIGLGKHPTNFLSTSPIFFSNKRQCQVSFVDECYFEEFERITIGNDVWIGANVLIKDGINIGDGAIIAAGAVVVKDVEPYSIVGGIPAKLIRKRFGQNIIDELSALEWWNKDQKWLKQNISMFNHPVNLSTIVKLSKKESTR